jgi:hypothetical protein
VDHPVPVAQIVVVLRDGLGASPGDHLSVPAVHLHHVGVQCLTVVGHIDVLRLGVTRALALSASALSSSIGSPPSLRM